MWSLIRKLLLIRCTDGNNFESECGFSCGIGFELVGSQRRICQDDQAWSGVDSVCECKRSWTKNDHF